MSKSATATAKTVATELDGEKIEAIEIRAETSGDVARKKLRVTLFVSPTVDQNIEFYAMLNRKTKADVIDAALRDYLERKGFKPDLAPVLTVTYA